MTRKEEIEMIARDYENKIIENNPSAESYDYMNAVIYGAEWADRTTWKPADGDNLPEIDREVIALVEENGYYKVVFAHRPKHNGDAYCFGKGGWNQPNVKWWLDLELPKMEE